MSEPKVVHNTFIIERSYAKPVERVFAAFADPAKKRKWFTEGHSHDVVVYDGDFRVGGLERTRYRMNEKTPFPGVELGTEGTYLDIVPNQRIVQAGYMTLGGRTISTSMLTIELAPSTTGTNLICTHQAAFFEGSDGPQRREEGWQKLLDSLGHELSRA